MMCASLAAGGRDTGGTAREGEKKKGGVQKRERRGELYWQHQLVMKGACEAAWVCECQRGWRERGEGEWVEHVRRGGVEAGVEETLPATLHRSASGEGVVRGEGREGQSRDAPHNQCVCSGAWSG